MLEFFVCRPTFHIIEGFSCLRNGRVNEIKNGNCLKKIDLIIYSIKFINLFKLVEAAVIFLLMVKNPQSKIGGPIGNEQTALNNDNTVNILTNVNYY